MKIKELLEYGKNNLIEKEEHYRISKMFLKHILKVNDTYLIINNEKEVSKEDELEYKNGIKLLKNGMPLQYITNNQEFMGINFYVDENVLIPQPDTEVLVEEVIDKILSESIDAPQILDLCTGSGAIGISIAKNIKDAKITMSDISEDALDVANKNINKNDLQDRCKLVKSDMFCDIKDEYNIIVSNPPYVKKKVIKKLDKEVQNEPLLALDGGEDGLEFYKIIAENSYKYLKPNGILALEIGYDQKQDVIELLKDVKKYKNIYSKKDLGGNDRIVVARIK